MTLLHNEQFQPIVPSHRVKIAVVRYAHHLYCHSELRRSPISDVWKGPYKNTPIGLPWWRRD